MEPIYLKKLFLVCLASFMLAGCNKIDYDPVEINYSEIDPGKLKEMGIDTFILRNYLEDSKQLSL
jgi:hypothetical protein